MDRVDRNSTEISPGTKSKCSKIVVVSFGAFVTICALGGLAIGLYFLISSSIKTTTTATSTVSGKHYFDLQSRAMKPKDFTK